MAPPLPRGVIAARGRAVGLLGTLSRPSRERIAVTGFFLGSEGRLDRALSRTYFEAANWAWAGYEDEGGHHLSFRKGLASLQEAPTRAVDLGTGAGGTAAVLAETFPDASVTGVDSSHRMVRRARLRHGDVPNLDFVVGDGLALDMQDGSVDLVTSLNYMPYPGEVRRIVRPGGSVLVASTFQKVGSHAVAAHWEAFGFGLLARSDADVGSFELYHREA